MANSFQSQLLKAGLVNKKQVTKANQERFKKQKQQRHKKNPLDDSVKLKAQQVAKEKANHDRELNRKKEQQARNKAISAEVDQLISKNYLKPDAGFDVVYNFVHRDKIKRIYVNEKIKQEIIQGKLGIGRIDGRYELIPASIAEKIKQRNESRVIIFDAEVDEAEKSNDDPYANYQVPDDLDW